MLNTYLKSLQRLLRDQNQRLLDVRDLTEYINRARREVAGRSQCIRRLTPISGPIDRCDLTDGGTGYTNNPTITISAPDFPSGMGSDPNGAQATASAIVNNGVIQSIDITYGGDGYFQPTVTITDSTGTGAEAELNVPGIFTVNEGQEKYNFADIDLSSFPGVAGILAVKSASILYMNYRFSLPCYSFSVYQARIRQFSPNQYQFVPAYMSQYGYGDSGSLFFYPIPSQAYQAELDMFCLPSDLTDDRTYEAIPQMWQDAVPFMAAFYAYNELQNWNAARAMRELFDDFVKRYGNFADPGRMSNPYGRW